MAKDPYRYFRVEARELVDQLTTGILDLEKANANEELVLHLLRLAHTLKGASRVVKQVKIADLIHGVEDVLTPHRDSGLIVPREQVDKMLSTLDIINAQLAQLAPASEEAIVDVKPTSVVQDAPMRLARADTVEIDVLMESLSEIAGELASIRSTATALRGVQELTWRLKGLRETTDTDTRTMADRVNDIADLVERNLTACVERIDRELRQARDVTQKLRLIPATSIFHALERTARDAANSVGIDVQFAASGGDLRLEPQVLSTVQAALVQLVRNAVVHGIEGPKQRQTLGKPVAGKITLEVVHQGYRAVFRCADDGRGIDLEAIRHALVKRGSLAVETNELTAEQLLTQLFKGGITTASSVTELAGRGVGLDVVRDAALRMKGEVMAETLADRGTTIELRVPLSLASLDVLVVETDGQFAAIPLNAVQSTLRVSVGDVVQTPDGTAVAIQGELIPLQPLILGVTQQRQTSQQTAVLIRSASKTMALAVTRLCGITNVVLRPLPLWVPAQPIVLGVYLDGEGNPHVVLDPEQFDSIPPPSFSASVQTVRLAPILIIDDSLTTRMLESSILESAGFVVEMATSAEEGLAMAQKKTYALFLVDVEMPGMDGFDFVEKTRADPTLRGVPSILVTSRNTDEDQLRGAAVGASAYIVKGEFDQVNFLQRVTELVRR